MTNYVVGFLFTQSKTECLLVKKNKPEFMKGFWNGIGGSMNEGEYPLTAMRREAKEEANLDIIWVKFAEIFRPDNHIHCFWSESEKRLWVPFVNDVGEEHRWIAWKGAYYLFETVPMLLELAKLELPQLSILHLGEPK